MQPLLAMDNSYKYNRTRSELLARHFDDFISIHKPYIENGFIPRRDEVCAYARVYVNVFKCWFACYRIHAFNTPKHLSHPNFPPIPKGGVDVGGGCELGATDGAYGVVRTDDHGAGERRAAGMVAVPCTHISGEARRGYFKNTHEATHTTTGWLGSVSYPFMLSSHPFFPSFSALRTFETFSIN